MIQFVFIKVTIAVPCKVRKKNCVKRIFFKCIHKGGKFANNVMEVLEQKSEPLVIQAFYDKKVLTSDVEGEKNLQLVLFYKTFKSFHK